MRFGEKKLIGLDYNSNLLREGETIFFNAIKKMFLVSSPYLATKSSDNLAFTHTDKLVKTVHCLYLINAMSYNTC